MQSLREYVNQASTWERGVALVVVSILVYLVLVAIGRWLKRRLELPLGIFYQAAAAATGLYFATVLLMPDLSWRREFAAVAILAGVPALLPLLNRVFVMRAAGTDRRDPMPKFLREVLSLFVYIIAVLLVLQLDYDIQVPGLIAGSGIAAIVIGFASQDLLGNIIGGFTLHFSRPFRVGDWLLLDNRHARVEEINWRSTRLRTNDNVNLDVPNAHIVKQTITNYSGIDRASSEPPRPHAMRLEIGIDYDAPPNKVRDLLAAAAAAAPLVLPNPAPDTFLKNFGESSVTYELRFWLADHAELNRVSDVIRTNIWYLLKRENIRIPFPIRTVQIDRGGVGDRHGRGRDSFRAMLEKQPIFAHLGEENIGYLIERCEIHHFGRGERIIVESAVGESMFVLTSGRAGVIIGGSSGAPTQVAVLQKGDCFGEMSLLTGEPRSATIQALEDCEVLEIHKPVFAEIVARDDTLLARLSELLAQRKLETEGFTSRSREASGSLVTEKELEYKANFLRRLKSFFEL